LNNTILVTGGAGFIGSAVVRRILTEYDCDVVNIDKLTYAGNLETVADVSDHPRYHFVQADICDAAKMHDILSGYKPSAIMHLAAESHVDRSIDGPVDFIKTNICGTYTLLEAARQYLNTLDSAPVSDFRFHHISTDEVFGSLGDNGLCTEDSRYQPNSPYSASKASSDHLVRAWHKTFGLPVVVSNCSNNYGPYQYPEKLLPAIIARVIAGENIPVYGAGLNIRDWLYVDDHASALVTIMQNGKPGRSYNVGGNEERTNIEVVRVVCSILDDLHPSANGQKHESLITYVQDRPGHDMRYSIDATRIKNELGWAPAETLESGMRKTVEWYLENQSWCEKVITDNADAGKCPGIIKQAADR